MITKETFTERVRNYFIDLPRQQEFNQLPLVIFLWSLIVPLGKKHLGRFIKALMSQKEVRKTFATFKSLLIQSNCVFALNMQTGSHSNHCNTVYLDRLSVMEFSIQAKIKSTHKGICLYNDILINKQINSHSVWQAKHILD